MFEDSQLDAHGNYLDYAQQRATDAPVRFGPSLLPSLSTLSIASVSVFAFGCSASPAPSDDSVVASSDLTEDTATITFDGSFHQTVSRPLTRGQTVRIVYDANRLTTCRGEQGNIPQWSIAGNYILGDAPAQIFGVAGLGLSDGSSTTFKLEQAGDLQLWFENVNRWGCRAFDSQYGGNYHFDVAPAPNDPGWVGNTRYAINRQTCSGGPCESTLHPLTTTAVDYDTYARQRAAIRVVQFDVWKEGVTDHDDADLWKKLDVQVHYRVEGESAFTTRYVNFDHRTGNDARYSLDLRDLDSLPGLGTITDAVNCPSYSITHVPETNDVYVQAAVEFYFTVNGVSLRPSSGKHFRVRYQNYAGLYAPCVK